MKTFTEKLEYPSSSNKVKDPKGYMSSSVKPPSKIMLEGTPTIFVREALSTVWKPIHKDLISTYSLSFTTKGYSL